MPFHIHAAGPGRFRYTDSGIDLEDIYDLGEAIGRLQTLATGGRGAVRDFAQGEAEGAVQGAVTGDSAIQRAFNAVGRMNGVRILEIGIATLYARRPVFPLRICLTAVQENTLWVDTSRYTECFLLDDDICPSRELLRAVHEALEETGLNSFGVLAAMGNVFTEFANENGRRGLNMLQFQIRH